LQTTTLNNVNQLTGLSTTSPTTFTGSVNKPTTLTVNGNSVTLDGSNNFSTPLFLPSGTQTVTAVAQDSSGNKRTNHYSYNVPGTNVAPTYDFDGNTLTDEKGNSYTWDALNRLISIAYFSGPSAGTHTEFAYDGLSRRVSIIEKSGTSYGAGTPSSTKSFVWIGNEIAEERDTNNNITTVGKRFFPQGEQQLISGTLTPFYYTRDHLGSVREVVDGSGNIVARYSYDPYGRPPTGQTTNLVSGSNIATFQYTGDYYHSTSGLSLTKYRAYDSNTGRWLSRDPIGERGGLNLYDYVGNNSISFIDALGTEGTWSFDISYPKDERPLIQVSYTMSEDEKKCCNTVEIKRYVSYRMSLGFMVPDPNPYLSGGIGNKYMPATADPDQPGGPLPSITLVSATFHFKWDAVCTSGKLNGKILSSRTKTYTTYWKGGNWDGVHGAGGTW
jgi:RHS repeat-associated protein